MAAALLGGGAPWGCAPPPTPLPHLSGGSGGRGAFVTHEGNFLAGNASLSYLDLTTGQVSNNVFAAANGRPLGDVCQSVTLIDSLAYLVVNNSGKIEVIHARTFRSVATITGLTSPRHLLPVSATKAYCTDLYANAVAVIDLPSGRVTGRIALPGWTEALVTAAGYVFITNLRRRHVYVVDPATDRLVDSVDVGGGSNSLCLDAAGKLWVACDATDADVAAPALVRLDPATRRVERRMAFDAGPRHLCTNGAADTLYALAGGQVVRLPITATAPPAAPFATAAPGQTFYALAADPRSGEVLVADARDYTRRGELITYRPDGSRRATATVGLVPGQIVFLP